jgi:hypothetical protein
MPAQVRKDSYRLTDAQIKSAQAVKQGVSVLGVMADDSTQVLSLFFSTWVSSAHVYFAACPCSQVLSYAG